jgi:hypothetical protein
MTSSALSSSSSTAVCATAPSALSAVVSTATARSHSSPIPHINLPVSLLIPMSTCAINDSLLCGKPLEALEFWQILSLTDKGSDPALKTKISECFKRIAFVFSSQMLSAVPLLESTHPTYREGFYAAVRMLEACGKSQPPPSLTSSAHFPCPSSATLPDNRQLPLFAQPSADPFNHPLSSAFGPDQPIDFLRSPTNQTGLVHSNGDAEDDGQSSGAKRRRLDQEGASFSIRLPSIPGDEMRHHKPPSSTSSAEPSTD